jgi:hypothetical protein
MKGGLRSVALVSALLTLASACGSTVKDAEQRRALSQGNTGLGGPAGVARSGPNAAGAEAPPVRDRELAGRASVTGPDVAPVTVAPGDSAPGVTKTEIKVGVVVLENGAQANEALGNEGITTGDQRRQYEILFGDLNKRGGILSHKVVPVYHEIDVLSQETADSQAQQTCAAFTEDNHVFAALGGLNDTFLSCMTKAGGVQVVSELTNSAASRFERFPHYFEISSPNLDRQAALWPRHLDAMGYFGKGAVVGVLTFDDPNFVHALDKVLVPGLRRLGFPPKERILIQPAQRFADSGGVAAQIQNAVLRFNSSGVTHVLIMDERAFITDFFLRGAREQRYFPRYGFNTQNALGFLYSQGSATAEQMKGAVGLGWSPFIGVAPDQDPASAATAPRRRCLDLMKRSGMSYSDRNAEAIALLQCDVVWFVEETIKLGGPITTGTFVTNVHKLGSRYLSTVNFANRFAPDRHDGTSALRRQAFFENCRCFRYTSPVIVF